MVGTIEESVPAFRRLGRFSIFLRTFGCALGIFRFALGMFGRVIRILRFSFDRVELRTLRQGDAGAARRPDEEREQDEQDDDPGLHAPQSPGPIRRNSALRVAGFNRPSRT